eukprot:SAG25_NODE_762_length_5510_cov_27.730179_2_plen_48_part_00
MCDAHLVLLTLYSSRAFLESELPVAVIPVVLIAPAGRSKIDALPAGE